MANKKYNAPLEQGLRHYKEHGWGYGVYANWPAVEMVTSAILDGATEQEILECVGAEVYEKGLAEATAIRNQTDEEKEANLRFGAEIFGHDNYPYAPTKR